VFSCIRWHPPTPQEIEAVEPLAVSVNDAARALGLGRTSIYGMIGDGRLETFKLGRRTLIKTASIRRLVDSQE
jgi:excisionase family DNA binding protein